MPKGQNHHAPCRRRFDVAYFFMGILSLVGWGKVVPGPQGTPPACSFRQCVLRLLARLVEQCVQQVSTEEDEEPQKGNNSLLRFLVEARGQACLPPTPPGLFLPLPLQIPFPPSPCLSLPLPPCPPSLPPCPQDVTNQQLRDDLMTMLIAGHETTAATLTWALHELARSSFSEGNCSQAQTGGLFAHNKAMLTCEKKLKTFQHAADHRIHLSSKK